ncbi:MAG: hypothetical protein F6K54_07450 [Okeania sp. SIO3B5]|uniref:hypothetical protein n=1 Tax=Okeania sp. SIO3B5 TaxID=2607811 RepID=UPI001400F0C4|nr:hypothetical protein [Okeania sp. SIO3B5]NEO52927.1 hypothetical protein [Okeania sp. SIO3B5]
MEKVRSYIVFAEKIGCGGRKRGRGDAETRRCGDAEMGVTGNKFRLSVTAKFSASSGEKY